MPYQGEQAGPNSKKRKMATMPGVVHITRAMAHDECGGAGDAKDKPGRHCDQGETVDFPAKCGVSSWRVT